MLVVLNYFGEGHDRTFCVRLVFSDLTCNRGSMGQQDYAHTYRHPRILVCGIETLENLHTQHAEPLSV